MTPELLEDLFNHMEWADSSVWSTVLASETTRTDDSVLDTLHHLHRTQRAFLDVWQGRKPDIPTRDAFDSAESIIRWARAYYPVARDLLVSLPAHTLDDSLQIPWAAMFARRHGRPAGDVTLRESALQVVLHTSHHRGQVARRLRELGGSPTGIDYVIWLWLDRPAPIWPFPD